MNPIFKNELFNAVKSYKDLNVLIDNRTTEIVNFCCKQIGKQKVNWHRDVVSFFDTKTADDMLIKLDYEHDFKLVLYPNNSYQIASIEWFDKFGNKRNLRHGNFPLRWLWEDYEDEFLEGLKPYFDNLAATAQKKIDRAQSQKDKLAKKKAALAKLTEEERKLLGLK